MAKHENDQLIREELLRSFYPKAIKSLTDADIKFIATIIRPNMRCDANAYCAVRNPHNGMSVMVKGYMYTMLAFINEMMLQYPDWNIVANKWGLTKGNAQSNFDRARYLVAKLDSVIYTNFVD